MSCSVLWRIRSWSTWYIYICYVICAKKTRWFVSRCVLAVTILLHACTDIYRKLAIDRSMDRVVRNVSAGWSVSTCCTSSFVTWSKNRKLLLSFLHFTFLKWSVWNERTACVQRNTKPYNSNWLATSSSISITLSLSLSPSRPVCVF